MKKISAKLAILGAALLPVIASAQLTTGGATPNFSYVNGVLNGIRDVLGLLTPIIFAIAILYFFWGLAKFIMAAGDDEARATGKKIMLWGIVGIFVMTAVYGLVQILANIVGTNSQATITLPAIPNSTATSR